MTERQPALRMNHHFALSSGDPVFDVAMLRRSDFALRFTHGRNISVDERLITKSFPLVPGLSRLVALAMIGGRMEVEGEGVLMPGDAMLLDVAALGRTRSQDASDLRFEWDWEAPARPALPRRLGAPAMDQVLTIADALQDRSSDQRTTISSALDLFRSIGAPLPLSLDALEGEPTVQDHRLARAMEEQFENVTNDTATTFHMGASMGLSERQVRRLFEDFSKRYAINARSWRDAKNRWRVQNAVLLLSRSQLTVADVAREVGYASPNALARAFSKVGFPPPAAIRQHMSEREPLF